MEQFIVIILKLELYLPFIKFLNVIMLVPNLLENLPLEKGVEKGGSHDKTRSACDSKKCPSGIRTFDTNYCKFHVGVEQEVEKPLPTLLF